MIRAITRHGPSYIGNGMSIAVGQNMLIDSNYLKLFTFFILFTIVPSKTSTISNSWAGTDLACVKFARREFSAEGEVIQKDFPLRPRVGTALALKAD